jgi:hypothetical protein
MRSRACHREGVEQLSHSKGGLACYSSPSVLPCQGGGKGRQTAQHSPEHSPLDAKTEYSSRVVFLSKGSSCTNIFSHCERLFLSRPCSLAPDHLRPRSQNESLPLRAAWPKGSGETTDDRLCPTVLRG